MRNRRAPSPFLSSNTQDFIEVTTEPLRACPKAPRFLSSNTQDFIEVTGMFQTFPNVTPIPEL